MTHVASKIQVQRERRLVADFGLVVGCSYAELTFKLGFRLSGQPLISRTPIRGRLT